MDKVQNHIKTKKLFTILFTLIFVGFNSTALASDLPATTKVVKRGDRGQAVTVIQQRLKNWAYYKHTVDGIFGLYTQEAVKAFQKKNSLAVDGVVGAKTAAKMGINLNHLTINTATPTPAKTPTATKSTSSGTKAAQGDVLLLAKLVYAESKGEIYRGKVAVAAVVLNRVDDARFPNTISGVIYQPKQFTCVSNGAINNTPTEECLRAARDALNGVDPSCGAVFFFNAKTTSSSWNATRKVITTIGNHTFTE